MKKCMLLCICLIGNTICAMPVKKVIIIQQVQNSIQQEQMRRQQVGQHQQTETSDQMGITIPQVEEQQDALTGDQRRREEAETCVELTRTMCGIAIICTGTTALAFTVAIIYLFG